jgi:hypothetical protein
MLKVNEKERIGWEELFGMVLEPNYNVSPDKTKTQQQQQPQQQAQPKVEEKGRAMSKNNRATGVKVFPEALEKERAKSAKKP